ncbi:gliding motility lipoprotein GldB [Altibacter sp. HG106]|nr:gliding motility lipoprotein GldB [Altibacter sp. HG106]MDC7994415.1 gliding motility lipoprotein GldB [Altibacter sp. HG106]
MLLAIGLIILVSCNSKSKREEAIEAIPVAFSVSRLDQEFAQAQPSELPKLKQKYPAFFPEQFPDSLWLQRMQDTLPKQLAAAVATVFPSEASIESELHSVFQHIKYDRPNFVVPDVVTVISDVDYRNKVIATDSVLVIGLDNYLGAEHPFYEGVKHYISKNLRPSQLAPDVASVYAEQWVATPRQRTFLAQLLYFGKQLYLKDLWLPDATDAEKIGYTEAEWQWAIENEEEIWRYFIEEEVLYSTDPKLATRFIVDAPFSKFYLEIDNESPGRIGSFIGWQIVRAYMENNDIPLAQLMTLDPETLFRQSKYKPNKQP